MKRLIVALAVFVVALGIGVTVFYFFSAGEEEANPLDAVSPAPIDRAITTPAHCEGTNVSEGQDLAAIANEAPKGATFCISGFHRLSGEIVPKDGQRFIGIDDAVLSGSKVLTSFVREGDIWIATGQTQDYSQAEPKIADEQCMEAYEGCNLPEDVYVDDAFLYKVLSQDDLEPGRYLFDYAEDRIYLADDPTGHEVEASIVRRAFANYAGADDVVIRGLVIEKFSAHSGEDGVIAAFNGADWVVEDNEIRLNHASGVMASATDGMVIRNNVIHHNGCGGIMGSGPTNLLIEGNEIAFNNALNYLSYVWSCGGGKLDRADGVMFRDNFSHDNNGFGFWTDAMNVNVTYEDNRFVNNSMGGIMHEINDGAAGPTRIIDNVFRDNGFNHPNRVMFGAAIVISASNDVEVAGNLLEGNAHGITLNYTPRDSPDQDLTIHDVSVHDNVIVLSSGDNQFSDVGRVGFYTSVLGAPPPTTVSFTNNRYFLGDMDSAPHFSLPDPALGYTMSTELDWRNAGFDTSSEFLPLSEFPSGS